MWALTAARRGPGAGRGGRRRRADHRLAADAWWVVALVALVAVAYVAVVPQWRYAVHRWEVTDTAVYTQTGWWARERRIAPMSRIQTVDHAEGAIARLFGLATVTVTTASAAGALEIEGLDRDRRAGAGRRADPDGRQRARGRHVTRQAGRADWQRLDPRMLLVYPVKELIRFLPALIALFIAGTRPAGPASGGSCSASWSRSALGVLRYFTTCYRITAGRIELRRGLLNRHVLSTPLDRVRTVDITAPPIHRLLGLTSVRIGTGTASTGDERPDRPRRPSGRPGARAARRAAARRRPARRPTSRGSPRPSSRCWSSTRRGCGSRR